MSKNPPPLDSTQATLDNGKTSLGAKFSAPPSSSLASKIEQAWDVLPGILWKLSAEGVVLDVNQAALDFSGHSKAEFAGHLLDEFFLDGFTFEKIAGAVLHSGKAHGLSACLRCLDGSTRDISIEASSADGGTIVYCAVSDRSVERRTEDHARAQAAFFDKTGEIVFTQSLDGIVTSWSIGAERFYGLRAADILGMRLPVNMLLPPEVHAKALVEVLEKGQWSGETQEAKTLMRWFLLKSMDGLEDSILVFGEDMAELRLTKDDRLRAHRHECVGTLAGGIAHDLNNVLQPISMFLDLLRRRLPDTESLEMLDAVESNLQRATDLVRQILTFSSGVRVEQVAINIPGLINEVSNFIRPTFPKTIQLQVSVSKKIHSVVGNETQLVQVLLNFCVNARDAMPNGGSLEIDASNVCVDNTFLRLHPQASAGDFVRITVRDTGHGIPKSLRKKIFEPFFTTKSPDIGTGLGLATAISIVRNHGGFLTLDSEEGCGSSFHAYLPAVPAEAPQKKSAPVLDERQATGHGEAIMIVDDEATVLKVMTRSLEKSGYRVIAAGDGEEAYALYSKYQEDIRLVITDLAMPGMDGPSLIAALRKINPAVRVICTSGLGSYTEKESLTDLGILAILSKPCNSKTVLQAIHDALTLPIPPA
jgi:two-component system cell cycle sensor histidine kinase/response regulator CckA